MIKKMKSKVKLSLYCAILTTVVTTAIIVGLFMSYKEKTDFIILLVTLIGMIVSGLFYFPKCIEATDSSLVIHRYLKSKSIPYSEIKSVDRCFPSSGGLRLCGSGGYMGYWGYFNDIIIGTYFGYYGDHSKCILVKLNSGKQYVISCESPDLMLVAINSELAE